MAQRKVQAESVQESLWLHRVPKAARAEDGRSRREAVPLEAHAELSLPATRASALSILRAQDANRVQTLIPIRYGRMLATPFTYLRGSAGVMGADLAAGPRTDLQVQLCGDAHLSNFGLFAAPDRRLLFDLNDFDETIAGPFEWDVKRLAASVVVAGRNNGFSSKECRTAARSAVGSYRSALAVAAAMNPLELFFHRFEFDDLVAGMSGGLLSKEKTAKKVKEVKEKASRKNSLGALSKLTEVVEGRRMILHRPPLVERLADDRRAAALEQIGALFDEYRSTLTPDRRMLLDRYSLVDIALKVVGVGSVGTRCFIALFESGDGEPLFLQLKEATASVLEPYLEAKAFPQAGQRVVAGQRLIQAAPDAFLGSGRFNRPKGVESQWGGTESIDFYFRQLWDGKFSATVETMPPETLARYAGWCGSAVAQAHARSGDAAMITGYIGDDSTFDKAVATFAEAYADQTNTDHTQLLAAVDAGELTVVRDV